MTIETVKKAPLRADLTDQSDRMKRDRPVEWRISNGLTDYTTAVSAMESQVETLSQKTGSNHPSEMVWLVEHPPLYTAGTSAQSDDLLATDRFPVYKTGRGGEYTYHGPGQRVAYVMVDLKERVPDLRRYVAALESWIIATLSELGVKGERREDRVGVWVRRTDKPLLANGSPQEDKIAAIGIRVRRWVTFHGISLNVSPDLTHYSGIIPCGIAGYGVTSLEDLGVQATMNDVDHILRQEFERLFGPTKDPTR